VLPFVFSGRLVAVVQADVLDVPVLGPLLAATGAVPVTLGRWAEVLANAQGRLEEGRPVIIFAEGRLNHGGPMGRTHTGAVRLALNTGVPIVPVGFYTPPRYCRMFYGRFQDKPRSGRFQLGGPIYLEIGKPWWPAAEAEALPGVSRYRQLTDRLAGRIEALSVLAEHRAAL
jgi:1-acyl-sn-glycerol-3-phosphate acyltransferase